MSDINGVWKNETTYGGSSTVTNQTIRDDGTYETHMVFPMGGGCEQHIYHHGSLTVDDGTIKLSFERGETEMKGCEDSSKNTDMRGFTDEEAAEARSLLAQEIPYSVDGDTLTMTVHGPAGEMSIAYQRQVE